VPSRQLRHLAAGFPIPDTRFGVNRHIALIYDGRGRHAEAVAAFIAEGLSRGQLTVYVDDAEAQGEVIPKVADSGVDVPVAVSRGQLIVSEPSATFLAHGHFDADAMLGVLQAQSRKAVAGGWDGLFIAGEMSWALGGHPGVEQLAAYEARCTHFFASNPAVSLCMYDRRRFDAPALRQVLLSHPWVFVDGSLCRNYHQVPPGMAGDEALAGLRGVDAILDDLVVRDAAERIVAGTAIAIESTGGDDRSIRLDEASRLARIYSELVLFKSQVLARSESAARSCAGSARSRNDHGRALLQLRGEVLGLQQRLDFWQDRVRRTVGLNYDPEELRVRYGHRSVRLSRRESQLIAALIAQSGRSLAARELLWRAWGGNHLSEAQVRTYVVQLRKKLASLEMPAALVNEPGVGYSLRFDPSQLSSESLPA
jgi:DNA-binding winged helix-turn-helix (wHTH) protein